MTNWLCWHVGTISDPKLAVVAKRSNVSLHLAIAFWAYVLEVGADSNPRGSLMSLDLEGAAIKLETEIETLETLHRFMCDKLMITNEKIINWDKRQHGKSTDRVRQFRERKKNSETKGNVSETHETPTVQDITRQDKDRGVVGARSDSLPPIKVIEAFDAERVKAFGPIQARPYPNALDLIHAQRWIAAGATPKLCQAVFAQSMQRRAANAESPPNSLKYFTSAIADAIAESKRPMPQGTVHAKSGPRAVNLEQRTAERRGAILDAMAGEFGVGSKARESAPPGNSSHLAGVVVGGRTDCPASEPPSVCGVDGAPAIILSDIRSPSLGSESLSGVLSGNLGGHSGGPVGESDQSNDFDAQISDIAAASGLSETHRGGISAAQSAARANKTGDAMGNDIDGKLAAEIPDFLRTKPQTVWAK